MHLQIAQSKLYRKYKHPHIQNKNNVKLTIIKRLYNQELQ